MIEPSYNMIYLEAQRQSLGEMFDYAVNGLNCRIDIFFELFKVSGMAEHYEKCNPTYVAGKNGMELALHIMRKCGFDVAPNDGYMPNVLSREFWGGWALAYFQWESGYSYSDISQCVLASQIISMYDDFADKDIELFAEMMTIKVSGYFSDCKLKQIRKEAGISQRELADKAGVQLRQIQLFEQGERDIGKAQIHTIEQLARVLRVHMEDLI